MAKSDLWCKIGNHWWTPERSRPGRKPVSCPDHRGAGPKPEVTCQYAVIKPKAMAECDDGSVVPVANGQEFSPGDQGMIEWAHGQWNFALFEPAPQPKPPKPARARSERQSRIQTTTAPPVKSPEELAEERRQRLAKARATKQANIQAQAEEAAEARRQRAQAEWAQIDHRVRAAEQAYEAAFQRAMKASGDEFDQAWHMADAKQSALIGMLNRKRMLAAVMNKAPQAD